MLMKPADFLVDLSSWLETHLILKALICAVFMFLIVTLFLWWFMFPLVEALQVATSGVTGGMLGYGIFNGIVWSRRRIMSRRNPLYIKC